MKVLIVGSPNLEGYYKLVDQAIAFAKLDLKKIKTVACFDNLVKKWAENHFFKVKKFEADYKSELLGERLLSTPQHYAYLKISEGCNRTCAFCAIPQFRGSFLSRKPTEVIKEAKWLAANGVSELFLVSENTTSYGKDTLMSFSNTVTLANTFADFVEQFNELAVYVNNNIISADANGVANVTANEVNFSGNVYVVGTLSAGLISLTGNTEASNLHVAGILTVDGNSQFNSAAVFSNTVNDRDSRLIGWADSCYGRCGVDVGGSDRRRTAAQGAGTRLFPGEGR